MPHRMAFSLFTLYGFPSLFCISLVSSTFFFHSLSTHHDFPSFFVPAPLTPINSACQIHPALFLCLSHSHFKFYHTWLSYLCLKHTIACHTLNHTRLSSCHNLVRHATLHIAGRRDGEGMKGGKGKRWDCSMYVNWTEADEEVVQGIPSRWWRACVCVRIDRGTDTCNGGREKDGWTVWYGGVLRNEVTGMRGREMFKYI